MSKHLSASPEQQTAEAYMLKSLEKNLGICFNREAKLSGVHPDAIDPINKVVVEAYAHIGAVKGGQFHKIQGDILKLALIEKKWGKGWRKILCFASDDAAKYVQGKSWVAEAARAFGVEIQVVHLPLEQRNNVVAAQKRQRMVNPS
ncbi:MAG: hypothetical protein DDT29_02347 [Dehalococcoidia bacterium]|nr:hypothetical protein [Bacillota bacterium]